MNGRVMIAGLMILVLLMAVVPLAAGAEDASILTCT